MEKYICIHGHFYQPPRENPWLDAVEAQDSAYPYHDWNKRVTAECYAPNSAARILGSDDRIEQIVNNYLKISFNFGPTILYWLEKNSPAVYRAILEADKDSRKRFSGHGSAIAQAYNHMIMPLANRRDKITQIVWGLKDFESRFQRPAEAMWLPETAVDLETLDIMAENGLRYTILSPYQASRIRTKGDGPWRDVQNGRIDPTMAYELRLPSGRKLDLFFYDGPVSFAVAFERLLANGERFAARLMNAFSGTRDWPQLVHIATDGETYGHHHRHGDMALAYALHHIESSKLARLTNYGEYLEKHPPTHEVEILSNTSWSCAHGVERWRSNCGCNVGAGPGWNQEWRAPLRQAMDWLRDELALRFEKKGLEFLADPWAARNDYVAVINDRSTQSLKRFLGRHSARALNEPDKTSILKLMELQRNAMLMFTSCGWFFNDVSGTEATQVMQYAERALQLGVDLFGDRLEAGYLRILERAKSNLPEHENGRRIFEKWVKPAAVNLSKVGAHYAFTSIFKAYPEREKVYCYRVDRDDPHHLQIGQAVMVAGKIKVTSDITLESANLAFAAAYLGDHNINGGVIPLPGEGPYRSAVAELSEAFSKADFSGVVRAMDTHFSGADYSLASLFKDDQNEIVRRLIRPHTDDAEAAYRRVYQDHIPLMRFLSHLGSPPPAALHLAGEYILGVDLRRALQNDLTDQAKIHDLLEEAKTWRAKLDAAGLGYAAGLTLEHMADEFQASPEDLRLLTELEAAAGMARQLPFEVDFWKPQNIYYGLMHSHYPIMRARASEGNKEAATWVDLFRSLGDKLRVKAE
ncbi:MAG: DUF3536 domain-containing protein [Chloroflexi bacterium]|nr:DUF3536 domain-containing protein [Chloroflexota bacterium]